ncbi:TetR/AcrR family transcriptional regulator [Paenibacillus sp. LS1]|uniref:TetR/AcrR family transcriptional regulator n=1 Tax=Paenibacillus sp. LS1 TaxID=2992120 RepID=UPI00223133D6|nr:TetR/AcrR family transcriptional regulator [Paenibacillus sp. LS1]MCW3794446.1 TetR/AcrR family transcriptional regulator [Paenibacillus sp. LS1]
MKSNENVKVQRSKQNFKNAYIELIALKGYSQVTVSNIVEQAGYNRSSYYKYFDGKEAITAEIMDEFMEGFIAVAKKNSNSRISQLEDATNHTIELFEHIKNNKTYFKLLTFEDTLPHIQDKFISVIVNILDKEIVFLTGDNDENHNDYLNSFRAFGTYGFILTWIKNDFDISPSQAAKHLINFYIKSYTSVMHVKYHEEPYSEI